jgi:hypothetical protein
MKYLGYPANVPANVCNIHCKNENINYNQRINNNEAPFEEVTKTT